MPGLTDWFDVFRCGTHVDRFGREVTITRDDIDTAIVNYVKDSAPIVVGHPHLDAPAYGWIGAFRRVGDIVQAKASTVADEFVDVVRRHLYKNRSLAFGPGLRFRHVGFLGAQAPAVKGLQDIAFSNEEEIMAIEFSDPVPVEAAAAEPVAEAQHEAHHEEPQSDEDMAALKAELAEAKRATAEANQATAAVQAKLDKLMQQARRSEFAAYTAELVKSGQLPQAKQERVAEFMECLDSAGNYEFAEGNEPVLERFKCLLNDLLKPVEFAEVATSQIAFVAPTGAQDIAAQIRSYRAELASQGRIANASQVMAHITGGK